MGSGNRATSGLVEDRTLAANGKIAWIDPLYRELLPGWIGSSIGTPVSSHIHRVARGRRGIATAMGGRHVIYNGTPILRIVKSESGADRPHCTPGVSAATSPDCRTVAVF